MNRFAQLLVLLLAMTAFSPLMVSGQEAKSPRCADCASMCEKTLDYFKSKGGKYTEAANLNTLMDCIAACKFNTELKARGSDLHKSAAAVCAKACDKCAKMCESMNDAALKDCVQMCKDCASMCSNPTAQGDCCGASDCCAQPEKK